MTIRRTLTWVFARPRIREAWHGKTLTIRVGCPRPNAFDDCAFGLDLRVPPDVAVAAGVTSGSLAVRGLRGSLRLQATSGLVSVADADGPVWASVTSGRISGTGLASPRVAAIAGSGSIGLHLARAPWQVRAVVGSGALNVVLPAGYRFMIGGETWTGSRRIDPTLVDPASRRVIDVTSGSGSVYVG